MSIDAPIPPRPPRAPQTPSADSILCYRTASAAQLASQASEIERVLCAIGQVSGGQTVFVVTADWRRLSYLNQSAIFRPRSGGAPDFIDAAEGRARQYVQDVNVALGRAGVLAALKAIAFLPDGLRLQSSTPVYDPDTLAIDHWLCRFLPILRASASVPEAEVSDGAIEVRLSEEGPLLGLVAQWRPITQMILSSPVAPPDPRDLPWTAESSQRAGLGADAGTDSGGPLLIYVLSELANGESQLLPYYVFDADPLKRRYPASQASAEPPIGSSGGMA